MISPIRAGIAVVIGAIFIGLLIWTMPSYSILPRGLVLPVSSEKYAKYTGQVGIYDEFNRPFGANILGSISVLYHTTTQTIADRDAVYQKAKEIAAAAGGNGVLVNLFGFTSNNTPAPLASAVLRGQVIFTRSTA